MSRIHGKRTVVILNGSDLSGYCNNSSIERGADEHDTTVYGLDAHDYDGGLLTGNASISGFYDSAASVGPRAVIEPLLGTKVAYVRRPEGTGSGLAQDSMTVLVTGYTETSPVADMVTWSAALRVCGDVNSTAQ